jgi:hypothetical protein
MPLILIRKLPYWFLSLSFPREIRYLLNITVALHNSHCFSSQAMVSLVNDLLNNIIPNKKKQKL